MKFVVFGDAHYKETPPAMRKEGYGSQILHKISVLQDVARKLDAKIIFTGDLFDKKHGTSLREINKLMSVIDEKLGWYAVCGNHDIQAYNQRLETQPIGILIEAGKIQLLDCNGINLGDGVVLTGESYHVNYETEDTFNVSVDDVSCRFHIHVTHAMIVERPAIWEHVLAEEVEQVIQCDMLVNGHNHAPFQYGEQIYNVGGLARTAKEKNYFNKTPKALIIDTDKKSAKWVDIPHDEDVWKGDIEKVVAKNQEELDEFVREMQELEIADEDLIGTLLEGQTEKVCEKFYSYIGE